MVRPRIKQLFKHLGQSGSFDGTLVPVTTYREHLTADFDAPVSVDCRRQRYPRRGQSNEVCDNSVGTNLHADPHTGAQSKPVEG